MHLKEITSQGYYIYEAPVRLWHWITALSIVVLAVTGYFIGRPLPSIQGEATFYVLDGLDTTDPFYHGVYFYCRAAVSYLLGMCRQ